MNTLGEIAKFSKGKGISKSDINENGTTECIRYGELYTDYGEIITDIKSKTNINIADLVLSETNDVIIPSSGETQIDIATASCVLKSGVALGGDLNIIKTPNNGIFLSHYLNSKKKMEIAGLAQGVSVVHLYSSQLASLGIYVPSLNEQDKVASLLSLLYERIKTQSKIIEQLQTLMQGLSEQVFTQQLRFKDDNGNDFPDWQKKKLEEVYSFGVTNSFSRIDLNYETGEIKNIHYGDIHTKFRTLFSITKEQVPYVSPNISPSPLQKENYCKEGDVIFADASEDLNDIGKAIEIVNLNNEKVLSGLHTILARPISGKLYVGFGGYLFQSKKIRKQIQKESQGTKVLGISAGRLANIELQLPSLVEQSFIANFFASLDKKIQTEKDILLLYENEKKYLLQNIFI
jgi:type I restriction enzyme S subunit